ETELLGIDGLLDEPLVDVGPGHPPLGGIAEVVGYAEAQAHEDPPAACSLPDGTPRSWPRIAAPALAIRYARRTGHRQAPVAVTCTNGTRSRTRARVHPPGDPRPPRLPRPPRDGAVDRPRARACRGAP